MYRLAFLVLVGLIVALTALPAGVVAQPTFALTGSVRFPDNQPVAGARVGAFQSGVERAAAITDNAGNYSLNLTVGTWLVRVVNPTDQTPWMYTDNPVSVSVTTAGGLTPRNFTVQRTQGAIVGRVLVETGDLLPRPAPGSGVSEPLVEIWSDGTGGTRFATIDPATGAFRAPLLAGPYNLQVVLDKTAQNIYANYVPLPAIVRQVPNGGTVSAGDMIVQLQNATISGNVREPSQTGVGSVFVQSIRVDGGYNLTLTRNDGSFGMGVAAGSWEVSALATLDAYVSDDVVATTGMLAGGTGVVEMTLVTTDAIIEGRLVDGSGAFITDSGGWAYARDTRSGKIAAYGEVNSNGGFVLRVPAGELAIGVLLPSGSPYSMAPATAAAALAFADDAPLTTAQMAAVEYAPFEQPLSVSPAPAGASLAATTRQVRLTLVSNTRTISGVVAVPGGKARPSTPLVVTAVPVSSGAPPQKATVNSTTGAFSLKVSPGTWRLNYLFASQPAGYALTLPEPLIVSVGAQNVTRNLTLMALDGVVAGALRDEAGAPLPGQRVWVVSDLYSAETVSGANGGFSIPVPLSGGRPTAYALGVDAICASDANCLLDVPLIPVIAEPAAAAQDEWRPTSFSNITVRRSSSTSRTVRIGGTVSLDGIRNDVDVKAERFQDVADYDDDKTNSQGQFEVRVRFNNATDNITEGRLVATKGDKRGTRDIRGAVSISQAGLLQQIAPVEIVLTPVPNFPASTADTFVVGQGWSFTLDDGTTLRIPPGAVPLPATELVRVIVEPTLNLPSDVRYGPAAIYGYRVSLFTIDPDTQGSLYPITEPLNVPAELIIRYRAADLTENQATVDRLRAVVFDGQRWKKVGTVVHDPAASRMAIQTTALGTWAIMQERSLCANCFVLPLVVR